MKRSLFFIFLQCAIPITGLYAQLIGGDVNKPVNQVYELSPPNYGTAVKPTFTVTAPTTCGGTGSLTITWTSGATAGSRRYIGMHNCMNYSGNLVYNCSPTCPPGFELNNGNSFSVTFTGLAPGIYTFGIHRDPNDDIYNNQVNNPFGNASDDWAMGGWSAGASDQNRCAVVGLVLLPVNSNNLTTCTISHTNATNCTTADGSVTISGLAANTNYETSYLVNATGTWSVATASTSTGDLTISGLLTGIYPVRIRRQGEICFRQFNIKVGNNSGIECFADNQLLDPALGTTLVTNGNFGVTTPTMPTNGSTDYTIHRPDLGTYGKLDQNGPGDSRYVIDDTTNLKANFPSLDTTASSGFYNWKLRYLKFPKQNAHLWTCIQLTGDHTGSNSQNNGTAVGDTMGYMMIVNANYRTDRVLNISNISLTAGRSYVFSFWAKNLQPFMPKNKNNTSSLTQTYQPILPRLALAVNGRIYDFADMTAVTEPAAYTPATVLNQMGWEQYNLRFVAPTTNASSDITIYNFQQGGYGNDFAIDDVQLLALSVIGDRIWNDLDRDGIQDINEPGMANVTATLLDPSTTPARPLQTTISDAFGYYQFANVAPAPGGTPYRVQFTLPAGYSFSPQTGGGGAGNATDSDPDPSTGISASFSISAGESELDVDCGLIFDEPNLPSSIGDYVWFDTNNNGTQDASESGLANVTLTLYDNSGNVVATTVSNASGYYRFDNVTPGNYRIGITQPSGTICTTKGADNVSGGSGDSNTDSDMNNSGANIRKTDVINVGASQQITNVDIGLRLMTVPTSSFGDLCWNDLNQNGIQNAGEPGLAGVKVVLASPGVDLVAGTGDDVRLDSVVTDIFGKWQFTNMATGRYFVQFYLPSGYSYTLLNQGSNEELDSDVNGTGISNTVFINNSPSGFNYQYLDVGFYLTTPVPFAASVGDFFWNDINGNGIQNSGEFGVPGINVELINSGGTVIDRTTTNVNGYYLFTNIAPAAGYTVKFSNIPPGYQITPKDAGGSDNLDSDIDLATGISDAFTLSNNESKNNLDGAIRQVLYTGNSTVGGIGWYDIDNDGLQDADEIGVPDMPVILRNAGPDGTMATGDDVLRTTITNSLGQFTFTGLPQGLYRVDFSLLTLIGFSISAKDVGTDDNIDSDGNTVVLSTSVTDNFRLLFGEDKVNLGLGLVPTSAMNRLGNRVWRDKNGNGVQDVAEPLGVQSVVVQLLDASGNLIDKNAILAGVQPWQTVSNANGYWGFVNLPDGAYMPRFSYLPPGFRLSPSKVTTGGGNNTTDSDVFGNGRSAVTVTLSSAQRVYNDIDLGLIPQSAVVGDYVWDDQNGDGIQDAVEPGIVTATATIYNTSNVALGSAITNAAGKYYFPNVPLGSYYLRYTNYPVGMQFTTKESNAYATNGSNVDPTTQRTNTYPINDYGDTLHIDAGLRVLNTANVGDKVWFDADNNGLQGSTETPVAGIVVSLRNAGADGMAGNADDYTLGTTMTDGNGYYQFIITPTGNNYYLQFSNLLGSATFTTQNAGGGTNDSRPSSVTGITPTFNLAYGGTTQNQDAGLINIAILRLDFEYFTAVKNTAGALLNWKLANNGDAASFDVMHSANGTNFSKIATLPGNAFNVNGYKFVHQNPANGNNYYKIVANDRIGKSYTSETRVVNYDGIGFAIYPNPATEYLNVSNAANNNLSYMVLDATGKVALKGALQQDGKIAVTALAKGSYTLVLADQERLVLRQAFVKQ
jgi:hypothetical protein